MKSILFCGRLLPLSNPPPSVRLSPSASLRAVSPSTLLRTVILSNGMSNGPSVCPSMSPSRDKCGLELTAERLMSSRSLPKGSVERSGPTVFKRNSRDFRTLPLEKGRFNSYIIMSMRKRTNGGSISMLGFIFILSIIGAWLLVNIYIFPKLGIRT